MDPESSSTRPTTVTFGPDVILGRRRSRAFSAQQGDRDSEFFRRQSIKYQFPRLGVEDDYSKDIHSVGVFLLFLFINPVISVKESLNKNYLCILFGHFDQTRKVLIISK